VWKVGNRLLLYTCLWSALRAGASGWSAGPAPAPPHKKNCPPGRLCSRVFRNALLATVPPKTYWFPYLLDSGAVRCPPCNKVYWLLSYSCPELQHFSGWCDGQLWQTFCVQRPNPGGGFHFRGCIQTPIKYQSAVASLTPKTNWIHLGISQNSHRQTDNP